LPPLLLTLLFVVVSQLLQLCWVCVAARRTASRTALCAASAPVPVARVTCAIFIVLFYSVIVIIIMFIVSTLFVVVNLDAPMAVRKTLFEGFFSSSPHDASLHSCSV
jgi:hypothetical protein